MSQKENTCGTHYWLEQIRKVDGGSKIILKAVDGKSPGLEISIIGQLTVKAHPSDRENDMSKIVEIAGRTFDIADHAKIYVTVPEGETEAHVFVESGFLGKRSDIESDYLANAMMQAEDAAIVRVIRAAGLTLADVEQMVANKPDPRLSPRDDYTEALNKDINEFQARQAERKRTFEERIDGLLSNKKWTKAVSEVTGPATGVSVRIDNLYFGGSQ